MAIEEFFFWEGKNGSSKINHLVHWQVVSDSRSHGGLGIGALKHRNLAFHAKWGWRFMQQPHSLWRKVIISTHGRSLNRY